jgi:F420H(2)-dependent quinone reductase
VIGNQFWMVSEHGEHSHDVRNIKANANGAVAHPRAVAQRTAHLLPVDDAKERLRSLPGINSAVVRLAGSDLLTVRIDLD